MIQTVHPETADQRIQRLFRARRREGYRPGWRRPGKSYPYSSERQRERNDRARMHWQQIGSHRADAMPRHVKDAH